MVVGKKKKKTVVFTPILLSSQISSLLSHGLTIWTPKIKNYCWLFRVSLLIDLGFPWDLGKGWWGHLGTFMISRPIYQGSYWWKFSIWNGWLGANQSPSSSGNLVGNSVGNVVGNVTWNSVGNVVGNSVGNVAENSARNSVGQFSREEPI